MRYVIEGVLVSAMLAVVVQLAMERLARRLGIGDTGSIATLCMASSISGSSVIQIRYFGSRPFGNLIEVETLIFMTVLPFLLLSFLPGPDHRPGAPDPEAVAETSRRSYIHGAIGWAIRTAMVSMYVLMLRSGTGG